MSYGIGVCVVDTLRVSDGMLEGWSPELRGCTFATDRPRGQADTLDNESDWWYGILACTHSVHPVLLMSR